MGHNFNNSYINISGEQMKIEKIDFVLNWVRNEYLKATKKFGDFHNAHEGFAVLLEEVDELWENVKLNQSNIDRDLLMMNEAIQVAAMAIRFIIDCGDQEQLK